MSGDMPCQFPSYHPSQVGRFWGEVVMRRYDYDRPWRLAAQVRTITRAQLLAFFDAYLAPAGPERRRLATHVRVSHRVRLNPNPHPNIPTLTLTLTRLATHVRVSHRVRLNPNPHPNIPTLTLTLTRLATHVRVSHRVRVNPNPHPSIPTLTLTLTRLATHVYSGKTAPRGQLKLDAVSEGGGAEPLYYPPEKPGRLPV